MRPSARFAPFLTVLVLLAPRPLAAQEPPAHFPTCSTDTLARATLTRVRFLLGGGDERRREAMRLARSEPDLARLVTEEPLCLAAADGYARAAHGGRGLSPPFPVVLVRAGEQYVVQLGGLAAVESDRWELAVFDSTFRLTGIDAAGARPGASPGL